jgi:hypothetical protein
MSERAWLRAEGLMQQAAGRPLGGGVITLAGVETWPRTPLCPPQARSYPTARQRRHLKGLPHRPSAAAGQPESPWSHARPQPRRAAGGPGGATPGLKAPQGKRAATFWPGRRGVGAPGDKPGGRPLRAATLSHGRVNAESHAR